MMVCVAAKGILPYKRNKMTGMSHIPAILRFLLALPDTD